MCAEGVAQVVEAQVTQLRPSERFLVALAERLVDEVAPERIAEDGVLVANEALALADAVGASAWATSSTIGTALSRPLFGVPSRPAV